MASRTLIRRHFAGLERPFDLRIGEITALERICDCGIFGIVQRIVRHEAKAADIRDTVRLGLMGGGLPEPEASALVRDNIDGYPLAHQLPLAADILMSVVNGLPPVEEDAPGKTEPEAPSSGSSPAGTRQDP